MHILPGQVARVKRVRLRCVSVCLRQIYVFILTIMMDHLPAETTNFFRDDPSIETRQAIALAILFLSAPKASNDFTSRSTDTVGSPFSIFATLD